jgi:hypothetical protein
MRLHLLLVCLALSACAAVVPGTAARLAAMDPLTADPGAIELVVILPPGLSVTPGSAVLEFGATRGTERMSGSYVLADIPTPVDAVAPAEGTMRGYALQEKDVERMRALQAEIAGWKQAGAAAAYLSLGIGGCAVGAGPGPEAVGSVMIRLAEGRPLLPLIRQGRLADLLGADVMAAIEPCKGAE